MNQIIQKIVSIIQVIAYYLLVFLVFIWTLIVLPFQLIYLVLTNKEQSNSNQNNDNSLYTDNYWVYNLKKAIIAIEFYKIKNSNYPSDINGEDFKAFLEKWEFLYGEDNYLLEFLEYNLIYLPQESGYELNLNQENNEIELELPATFWKGLGIVKTNVKGFISISESNPQNII